MKDGHTELRPAEGGRARAWLRRALGRGTPRARLSAPATLRLGQQVEVEWWVEPSFGTSLVVVSLVGAEVARRRISARTGISIVAERSDFFAAELDRCEVDASAAAARGRGAAVIPAGLVPTLAGRFNDVAWRIVVDIVSSSAIASRQEFPLTVLPGLR
jgi:hypothetical protein